MQRHVTPSEAFELSGKYRTVEDIDVAKELWDYCSSRKTINNFWDFLSTIATIWNAGRMQGVREERLKKGNIA